LEDIGQALQSGCGLIYGGVIFKEKNIAVRTIGTLLMVAGAVLITIYGSRFQVSGVSRQI